MWGSTRIQAFAVAVAFGLGVGVLASGPAKAAMLACEDVSNLCVDSGGAVWKADKSVSPDEKKKRIEKAGSTLSLTVDGGRASVFVNGRYAGTAPLSSIPMPAGPNDVQVRDGATVISTGVLWVPKSASVSVTVRHP
ncbi:MAG TPA: hypothetical protein VFG69_03955 [Nannocystaceae bacterium]|nr:hypothetical protein [Nannocystaceae bacterium]